MGLRSSSKFDILIRPVTAPRTSSENGRAMNAARTYSIADSYLPRCSGRRSSIPHGAQLR